MTDGSAGYCARCATTRVAGMRFCGACGLEFAETSPLAAPEPAAPRPRPKAAEGVQVEGEEARSEQEFVDVPDDPMWRDDLLGHVGQPFHLAGGIDVIVGGRAAGGSGLTFLLQNPYGIVVDAKIDIGQHYSWDEGIDLELAPLEVLMVVVPLVVGDDTEMTVRISSDIPEEERIRAAEPGKYNAARTALGVAGGIAGLLLLPVAHFSWSRSGGDVGNPFVLEPKAKGGRVQGAAVRTERLWAPPDEPAAVVRVRRRRTAGREVRWLRLIGLSYIMVTAAGLAIILGRVLLATPSIAALLATTIAGGVAFGIAYGMVRRAWVVRPRTSRIAALVSADVIDMPHPQDQG